MTIKDFPVTRYQGSKRKILLWIHDAVKENKLRFGRTLDVFGGSASVSYLFKKMNKEVVYNDNLRFNHLIGKAIIENHNVTVTQDEVDEILAFISDNRFITETFDDIYFLQEENEFLDNVINGIEHLLEDEYKKAICYYAVFQACIIKRPFNLFHRKNLYIRTNDVVRNFGNKTTWEQKFDDLFRRFVEEANALTFDNGKNCRSINESAFTLDPYQYGLVYLDPPYFKQNGTSETANYMRCYHFLEGIANYPSWGGMIDADTPNKRFKQELLISEFDEKYILEKFEELIVRFRHSKIIFSYKKGGRPGVPFIEKTMKDLGKRVFTKSIHYKYALNHQNGDAKKNREVLIIGV